MSGFTFKLEQTDEDSFALTVSDNDTGSGWCVSMMRTPDAVALFLAVEEGIGEYVREMRAAQRAVEHGRSLAEYAKWRGGPNDDLAYDLSDPKSPGYHERMAGAWDDRDKGTPGASC